MPPVASPTRETRHWALILGPMELGVANKSGQFDESVTLDWEELHWITPFFASAIGGRASGPLWQFSQIEYLAKFRECLVLTGLDKLKFEPYSLRHGGASFDRMTNRRTLDAIKRRGRWTSDSSLRRYERAATAQRVLTQLPEESKLYGHRVAQHLQQYFKGTLREPPPAAALRAAGPSAN